VAPLHDTRQRVPLRGDLLVPDSGGLGGGLK
jgi:hypothetical protein